MNLGFWNIRRKLSAIVMVVCAASVLFAGIIIWMQHTGQMRVGMIRNLGAVAQAVGNNCAAALHFDDAAAASEMLASLSAAENVEQAAIYAVDGERFAEYSRQGLQGPIEFPARPKASGFSGSDHLELYWQIDHGGKPLGTIFVRVNQNEISQWSWRFVVDLAVVMLAALILALLFTGWFHRFLTRPITQLSQVAQAITKKNDFDARAERVGNDEVGILVDSFNAMLAKIQGKDRLLASYAEGLETEVRKRTLELQHANEQLRTAINRANTSAQAKSQFLANMSHEIRTPMNAILGMTDLVLETRLSPEQADYLSAVKQSAVSLLAIIDDILDYSKIEAGKMHTSVQESSLGTLLTDTLRSLSVRAEGKGLEVALEMAPGMPELLHFDAVRLQQVLNNLVGNAIKFTHAGEIVLTVALVETWKKDVVLFSVRDTGIGIAEDKLEHVFDSFSQADNSITRRFGGTGLGLAISKRLVELMGGKVWVESEMGVGTTFFFTIPMRSQKETQPETPAWLRGLTGKKILVVEPSETMADILQTSMESVALEVVLESSVDDALVAVEKANAKGQAFTCCVIEGSKLELDAFALIESLRSMQREDLPALLLFNHRTMLSGVERCEALANIQYLLKPVQPADLFKQLARLHGLDTQEREDEAETVRVAEVAAQGDRSLEILIAEDNKSNQKLALTVLGKAGHNCRMVDDGAQCVAAFQEKTYDLILMDLQMPEMDGLEATRQIRQLEAGSGNRVPIVALTANVMEGDREACEQAGMDDFLSKPLRPKALRAFVAQFLEAMA